MPYLAFNLNNGNEFIFDLVDDRLSLGRNARNEILIENNQISSFHAELLRRPGGEYEVVDLQSSNGTFVNNQRVQRAVLRPGDKISFGQLEARFNDSAVPPATLEAQGRNQLSDLIREEGATRPGPGAVATQKIPVMEPAEPAEGAKPGPVRLPIVIPPLSGTAGGAGKTTAPGPSVPRPAAPPMAAVPPPAVAQSGRPGVPPARTAAPPPAIGRAAQAPAAPKEQEEVAISSRPTSDTQPFTPNFEPTFKRRAEWPGQKPPAPKIPGQEGQSPAAEASLSTGTNVRKNREELENRLLAAEEALKSAVQHASLDEALAKKREAAADLEARMAELTVQHEALIEKTRHLEMVATELEKAEDRHEELQTSIKELADQQSQHETTLNHLAAQMTEKEQALKALGEEAKALQAALQGVRTEVAGEDELLARQKALTQEASKALSTVRTELEEEVNGKEAQLQALEERLVILREQESEAAALAAERQRELADAEATLKETVTAQEVAAEQRARDIAHLLTLDGQRAEKETSLAALVERGTAQHTLVETLTQRQKDLEDSIEELQSGQEEARRRLDDLLAAEKEAGQKFADRQAEHEKLAADQESRRAAEEAKLKDLQEKTSGFEKRLAELKEAELRLEEAQKLQGEAEQKRKDAETQATTLAQKAADQQKQVEELTQRLQVLEQESQVLTDKQNSAEAVLAKTRQEEEGLRSSLESLHLETESAMLVLATKKTGIADVENRLSQLEERRATIETLLSELEDTEQKLEVRREELSAVQKEAQEQKASLEEASRQKLEVESAFAQIQKDTESDGEKLRGIQAELETASRELQQARTERAQLDARTTDIRSEIQMLTSTLSTKRSDTATAERNLENLYARIAAANERLAELEKIDNRMDEALAALKTAERQRDQEERTLVDLEMQRETLRREVITLGEQEKLGRSRLEDQARKYQREDTRIKEAQEKVDHLSTEANTLQEKLVHMERRLQATVDEEKAIRAGMPELNAAMTAAQRELQTLLAKRSEAETLALTFARETVAAEKRLEDLEERAAALTAENGRKDKELAELKRYLTEEQERIQKVMNSGVSAGEQLAELQASILKHEELLSSSVVKHDSLLKQLRDEEATLAATLRTLQKDHREGEAAFIELQDKIRDAEDRCNYLQQTGDRIVSLQEAASIAEARKRETEARLNQSAELETSLQAKVSGLQETLKKESQRMEMLRREREQAEMDLQRNIEKAGQDAEEARLRMIDQVKREEAQMTARFKDRIQDLEQKHELLRSGLAANLEEQTVMLFASDLIKRLDLIDNLIRRHSSAGEDKGVPQQLRTLRASFEDVLAEHGITEFSVPPGTDVSVGLRQRITVVENITGKSKPRVVENYRPGFIYAPAGGREIILRKAEVRTSSE